MELTCQNCYQQIPEYDYDWKRLAAECDNCGSWTAFSSAPRQYDRVEPDPHALVFQDYTQADYIDFAMSLDFQRSDGVIVITQSPSNKVMTSFVSTMSVFCHSGYWFWGSWTTGFSNYFINADYDSGSGFVDRTSCSRCPTKSFCEFQRNYD